MNYMCILILLFSFSFTFLSCKKNNILNYDAMGSRVWQIDKTVLIFETNKLPKNIYIEYSVTK